MIIAIIAVVVLIALLMGMGFLVASHTMRINPMTLEEARKWQEDHYDISWYDAIEKLDYTVYSYDGYMLHAQLLKNPKSTGRYVIISHGYNDNRFGALKYACLYLSLGFNCIIYDLRGHGLNERTFCTYSLRESRDLDAMIFDAHERFHDLKQLGIHGESLGASTSITVLRYQPEIDFVVADCGFSDITPILKAVLKRSHISGLLFPIVRICARLRYGYDFNRMRPITRLRKNEIPVLFIHGEADNFIPSSHSVAMNDANPAYSELLIVPGAKHAQSVFADNELYRQRVEAFIKKVS